MRSELLSNLVYAQIQAFKQARLLSQMAWEIWFQRREGDE